MLLLVLGGVFLLGFTEAVNVAIPLVAVFLGLNAIVIVEGLVRLVTEPGRVRAVGGRPHLQRRAASRGIIVPALLAFPLLVLGLSGFETGVSMMPLVASKGATPEERLASRIRNTKKLLTAAAVIMSVFLISSSLVTTILIPAEAFEPGGEANGRALAYLAHEFLGDGFGTVYDISSVLILWFAGASAMAGLINIVPRYLPTYGMAPEWSRSVRPVVLVYTTISILITIAFNADVDAQAGAYATGILAMMVSASFAVLVSAIRRRQRVATIGFAVLTLVLGYAFIANVIEKPDGITISLFFILGIVVGIRRLPARTHHRDPRRAHRVRRRPRDGSSRTRWSTTPGSASSPTGPVSATPPSTSRRNTPNAGSTPCPVAPTCSSSRSTSSTHRSSARCSRCAASRSTATACCAPTAPRRRTRSPRSSSRCGMPRACGRTRTSSGRRATRSLHMMRYILLGRGDTPPVVREIIREVENDPDERPVIHVGG